MRSLLVLALVLAPATAHADMYAITVEKIVVKTAKGKETNDAVEIAAASYSCNLDQVHPAKGQRFTVWLDGTIEGSKLRTSGRKRGGAPEPVVSCARLVLVNSTFSSPPGDYRVTATVSFH